MWGLWLIGPLWTRKGICWPTALKKSRLQPMKAHHQGPVFSLSLSAALCSVSPYGEKPLAFPDPPIVAAKWLQLFQPSHLQASPCRGRERLLLW